MLVYAIQRNKATTEIFMGEKVHGIVQWYFSAQKGQSRRREPITGWASAKLPQFNSKTLCKVAEVLASNLNRGTRKLWDVYHVIYVVMA